MADFPLSIWFSVKISEYGIKTLVSTGEGGRERRRNKVSAPLVRISFPLKQFSAADLTTLYNFYIARLGSYGSFNVTVNGTVYLVRFAKDGLSWDWFHQNWYSGSIELMQVTV